MKRLPFTPSLFVFVVLVAFIGAYFAARITPAYGQTYATAWTREVLVTTTAGALNRVKNSAAIRVTNNGPNALWCALGKSTSAVIGKSERIGPAAERPSNFWTADVPDSVDIWCLVETANQLTTAATVVSEAPKP